MKMREMASMTAIEYCIYFGRKRKDAKFVEDFMKESIEK